MIFAQRIVFLCSSCSVQAGPGEAEGLEEVLQVGDVLLLLVLLLDLLDELGLVGLELDHLETWRVARVGEHSGRAASGVVRGQAVGVAKVLVNLSQELTTR